MEARGIVETLHHTVLYGLECRAVVQRSSEMDTAIIVIAGLWLFCEPQCNTLGSTLVRER
jgi:hypothetical protein